MNGPDSPYAPVGLDGDARIKLCDFPLFAPKHVLAGGQQPIKLALDPRGFIERDNVAFDIGGGEAGAEEGAFRFEDGAHVGVPVGFELGQVGRVFVREAEAGREGEKDVLVRVKRAEEVVHF